MQRDPIERGTARDWLQRARSNLARSQQPKPDEVLWEDLCFDAQQAVEKALKAVLLARGIQFRFVHDISELLTLLQSHGVEFPNEIRAAADLTPYAVETRYPGVSEPVKEEEFKKALRIAKAVVRWAELQIENGKRS